MENRIRLTSEFITLLRETLKDDEPNYETFVRLMNNFRQKKSEVLAVWRRLGELFSGHRELLDAFNRTVGSEDSNLKVSRAEKYLQKAKEETESEPWIYDSLVTLLKDKSLSNKQKEEQITELLGDYPRLLEDIYFFFPEQSTRKITKLAYEPVLTDEDSEDIFFPKLKKTLILNSPEGSDFFLELCKAFELYKDSVITFKELLKLIRPLFTVTGSDPHLQGFVQKKLDGVFNKFKEICISRENNRRKHNLLFSTLPEAVIEHHPRIGHSYIKPHRPLIRMRQPNKLINRQLISVPRGSEDVSFQHFRSNPYEDVLFRCEDEHLNLDLTIHNLQALVKSIENREILNPIRVNALKVVYGDYTDEMLDYLYLDPEKAGPVLINRINSKIASYNKEDFERFWTDQIKKNFNQSLDHRSFYFMQHENDLNNARAFLNEAKERYDLSLLSSNAFSNYYKCLPVAPIPSKIQEEAAVERRKYLNAPINSLSPQYMFYMSDQQLIVECILLVSPKENDWVAFIFHDFMGLELPKPFSPQRLIKKELTREDMAKKFIDKWIDDFSQSDSNSLTDHEPMLLRVNAFRKFQPQEGCVFYCPVSVYIFLRYFYMLYERLLTLKSFVTTEEFWELISLLRKKSSKLEAKLKEMVGAKAYMFINIDKLIVKSAKALQKLIVDEASSKAMSLFAKAQDEIIYYTEAVRLGSPVFRLHWTCPVLGVTYVEVLAEGISGPAFNASRRFFNKAKHCRLNLNCLLVKVGRVYTNCRMSSEDIDSQTYLNHQLVFGMSNKQLKLKFVPEGEDISLNLWYYSRMVAFNSVPPSSAKHSFAQAVIQHSHEKFNAWRTKVNRI